MSERQSRRQWDTAYQIKRDNGAIEAGKVSIRETAPAAKPLCKSENFRI